jgi:hypothetical protein
MELGLYVKDNHKASLLRPREKEMKDVGKIRASKT